MFRTTSTLKHCLESSVWLLAFALLAFAPCAAQERSSDDEVESKPSSTVFGRLFGPSSKKPSNNEVAKPKVPASTTSARSNRNGFLLPLKSFTKAFRGPTEGEMTEDFEESSATPPRMTGNRIPREPFRNLPRAQERRDRATNDVQVHELNSSPAPISPPPIVRPEQMSGVAETSNAPATKPLEGPTRRAEAIPSTKAPELLIESNSTSRRTAMDIQETATPRITSPRSEKFNNSYTQNNKRVDAPKNLVDIGKSSGESLSNNSGSSSNKLTSVSREPVVREQSPSRDTTIPNDMTRTPRSGVGYSKPESKDRTPSTTSPTKSTSMVEGLHREMAIPGVKIAVNGPSSILIDQEGSYEVVAKNEGTEALNGLMVRIAVPQHVVVGKVAVTEGNAQPDNDQDGNAIIWEIEHIPAGGSKSMRLILQTSKPEHFALGVEWTVLPQSTEMQILVQQPQLAIALEGPSEVEFGKPQMYRIRVRNPGNADVKAVSVALSAEPYGSNQSDIGDIAAGSERIVEVELTFQQSGTLPIVATALSESSKLKANSAIDVQVKQSELIARWFGPAEFYQGSVADYELEIANTGSIGAHNTVCKVKLPAGTDIVSMPPGATRSGDSIKWEVKKIDPLEKQTYPLRLVFTKLGDNGLSFVGECSSGVESKADFVTNVDAIADLHLSVVDPVAPAPVGQPVIYEIIIANRGKKAASDVSVVAQFSEGIEPIRVEGHSGRIVPGQAVFNSIPSIGPNEKLVLRVVAQAAKAGVHRFRAEVKSQGSDTDLLEEESTRYLATSAKSDRR